MSPKGPAEIWGLYERDKLIIHSMPLACVQDRRKKMEDRASLKCGSLLFGGGLVHQPSGTHLPNSVARFGDPGKVRATVLGTLHELDAVWRDTEALEAGKPEGQRGEPLLFFTNCDMCDVANASGGQPMGSYMDCTWQVTPPVAFQRPRSFDFRGHIESAPVKDDARKHGTHLEWNELRGPLSETNMVGLVYLADPGEEPSEEHARAMQELRDTFKGYKTYVFLLPEPGGVGGDLLGCPDDAAVDACGAVEGAVGARAGTFKEGGRPRGAAAPAGDDDAGDGAGMMGAHGGVVAAAPAVVPHAHEAGGREGGGGAMGEEGGVGGGADARAHVAGMWGGRSGRAVTFDEYMACLAHKHQKQGGARNAQGAAV